MLLGVLLALAAGIIVIFVVSQAVGPSSSMVTVVVAAEPLNPGTVLTTTATDPQDVPISTAFTTKQVNSSFVPADAFTYTTPADLSVYLTDKVVVGQYFIGDILRTADKRLVPLGSAAPGSITNLNPAQLPKGSVLFPLTADKSIEYAPGDHVDILVTVCAPDLSGNGAGGNCTAATDVTQTTLQDVYVYAVGTSVIDLVLTHQQALDLKFIAEHGKITLALRKPGDDNSTTTAPVTGPYILQQFGIHS
jgi:Flp pilus assembly protein CpaB